MKINRTFLLGLAAGVLFTLLFLTLSQKLRPFTKEGALAEIQGETLTHKKLRSRIRNHLLPIENDEYTVLRWGVDEWVQNRLFEKEAKAQGLTLDEFYKREIWSKVKISSHDVQDYYLKNKELFRKPLSAVHGLVSKQIRYIEFARLKDESLARLKKKYNARIFLKEPDSFIEGLAVWPEPWAAPSGGPRPKKPSGSVGKRPAVGTPPTKGPPDAPIQMVEFADFHCAFCKRVSPTLEEIFKKYPGQIEWSFRHFPLSKTPGSGSYLTHEAAACAKEQGKFWEYYEAIFASSAAPQESNLLPLAQKVGLDTNQFQDCLKTGKHRKLIEDDLAEGVRLGVQGTPTILINGQSVSGAYPLEHFVGVIESVLHPEKAGKAPVPGKPAPPAVVSFNDLEGRPSLGPQDAPVTLVEFSDFYCPFCKRVTPTLEELMKNYPGKIRRVWRHYPLSFHTGSARVHEASECANDQGKFWPFHTELFKRQSAAFDDEALNRLAKETGLNKKQFEKCLKSGRHKKLIQEEIARGNEVGVQGTPAVFVNGKLVSGAQPYENFDAIVKDELGKS